MIAVNEAADVLRHGWYDAAATLAADIPEVAELLQARLEIAITSQLLDERHLLDTIEEVEAISSRAGSPASETLALRLRRTVYEYLLALDAVVPGSVPEGGAAAAAPPSPVVTTANAPEQPATASTGEDPLAPTSAIESAVPEPDDATDSTPAANVPLEFAHDASAAVGAGLAADAADDVAGDDGVDGSLTPRRRFAVRRRGRGGDDDADIEHGDEPVAAAEAVEVHAESGTPAGEPGATFVAPKAGFHILDDEAPPPEAGNEGHDTPLPMPAFASDEIAGTERFDDAMPGGAGTHDEFLAWEPASAEPSPSAPPLYAITAGASLSPAMPLPAASAPGLVTAVPPQGTADDADTDAEDDDDPQRGWRVRRNGEPRRGRGAGLAQPFAEVEDDPFEGNTKLAETRRRIEDRLRHKRCDEAAALLQEIALEPGGRAIADLAMNAGDRCRALGKSNAALNCYLAASRSDPVYELPLSRLADVCIDDKDTDLAVSYLERVARIYRYRGDDKGALRVYRRIATIAPYREDVLTLLMAAQGTGRIDT